MGILSNADRAHAIYALAWVECGIALIVVGVRTYTRIHYKILGADDVWMIIGVLMFLACSIFITYYGAIGGFKHEDYLHQLGPDVETKALRGNYIWQSISVLSYAPPKTSVGLLILRIIGTKPGSRYMWYRWSVYIVLALVWIVGVLGCLFTFIQCDPTDALWNLAVYPNAKCWNPITAANFDIFTSAIPSILIFNLQMSIAKKINLYILFGLGLIAGAFGIVKTCFLGLLAHRDDLTWQTYNLIVWTFAELFVLLVCSSIPPISPLWSRRVRKRANDSLSSAESNDTRTGAAANSDMINKPYGDNFGYSLRIAPGSRGRPSINDYHNTIFAQTDFEVTIDDGDTLNNDHVVSSVSTSPERGRSGNSSRTRSRSEGHHGRHWRHSREGRHHHHLHNPWRNHSAETREREQKLYG